MAKSKKHVSPKRATVAKQDDQPKKLSNPMSREEILQYLNENHQPTMEALLDHTKFSSCYIEAFNALNESQTNPLWLDVLREWVRKNPCFPAHERYLLSSDR
ncbi:MAG: hypothetical protein Q9218_008341, partial [Villophora microphyllina]